MKLIKMILAVCGSVILYSAVAAEDAVDYRLPPEIQPLAQSIELNLDPGVADYSGKTVFNLNIEQDTDRIGIYQIGLEMSAITLRGATQQRTLGVTPGEYDINWLADGATIPAGQYELSIDFRGDYSTDALGLYRTRFEDNDYLFTQMESMYFRRAVPSFDEPAFKIPYTLTVRAPEDLVVIANTPVAKQSSENGWQRVEFMPSKPLSSYLIALAVGPLDSAPIEGMSVPGRVYVPKGHADKLGYVLEQTPIIVKRLEEWFGSDYPFRKLDFVGVPEFAFGGMENVGLVTYRVEYLTHGDSVSGAAAARLLGVIAHEVGHMWFGDLVTMEWWNDLWLNESFASWIDEVIVSDLYPEFETELGLPQAAAFSIDSATGTKAIRKETRTEADVNEGGYLPYVKGLTLLRMLENYVGAEKWQEGVRSYLNKYAWSNATEPDLWKEISAVSGVDVSRIAGSFLNQPGVPLLSVDKSGAVSQTRYLRYGTQAADLQWTIPLNVKYKNNGEIKDVFYLLDKKTGVIDLPKGADWVLPDAGADGYYRWQIDQDQFHALIEDIGELENKEKMALLDNSDALVDSRLLSFEDYMFVLTQLLHDPHPLVLLRAVNGVIAVGNVYVDDSNRADFARFVDAELGERFADIGLDTRADDSETVLQLRPRLVRLLGQYGSDRSMHAAVAEKAALYLRSPEAIDSNLALELLRVTAMNDSGKLFDDYVDAYLNSSDTGQRTNIMRAIYFQDPDVIRRALDFSISDAVMAGDTALVLRFYAALLNDQALLYDWLEKNLDAFEEKIPANNIPELPSRVMGRCTNKNLALMQAFFADRDDKYAASLARQLETARSCISTRDYNSAAFADFLAGYN